MPYATNVRWTATGGSGNLMAGRKRRAPTARGAAMAKQRVKLRYDYEKDASVTTTAGTEIVLWFFDHSAEAAGEVVELNPGKSKGRVTFALYPALFDVEQHGLMAWFVKDQDTSRPPLDNEEGVREMKERFPARDSLKGPWQAWTHTIVGGPRLMSYRIPDKLILAEEVDLELLYMPEVTDTVVKEMNATWHYRRVA